jgi:hypothetical protein
VHFGFVHSFQSDLQKMKILFGGEIGFDCENVGKNVWRWKKRFSGVGAMNLTPKKPQG